MIKLLRGEWVIINSSMPPENERSNRSTSAVPAIEVSHDQRLSLRHCVELFNHVPALTLRRQVTLGFFGLCGLIAITLLIFGWPGAALGTVGFALLVGLFLALARNLATEHVLLSQFGRVIAAGRTVDWIMWGAGLIVLVATLVILGLVGTVFWMTIIAGLLATIFHFMLDRQVEMQRRTPKTRAEEMLKTLRGNGADEQAVRHLVCEQGGDDWEPFFEAMFGYQAMINARALWGLDELGRKRQRRGVWRDRVLRWLEARIETPQETAHVELNRVIEKLEAPDLADEKMAPTKHADRTAKTTRREKPPASPPIFDQRAKLEIKRSLRGGVSRSAFGRYLGARTRFLLGLLLISGCLLWLHQNDMVPYREIETLSQRIADEGNSDSIEEEAPNIAERLDASNKTTQPLTIGLLPVSTTSPLGSYWAGLAGLMLVFSSLFKGASMGIFAFPAAGLAMFGHHWGFGSIWGIDEAYVSAALGLVVLAAGVCVHLFTAFAVRVSPFGRTGEGYISLLNARGEVIHDAPLSKRNHDPAAIRLLRTLLATAVRFRASDVHVEPDPVGATIRLRIDGIMIEVSHLGQDVCPRLTNLVKILCELDFTQHRIAQEGHFSAIHTGRQVDYRVSFAPSVHGQKLVVRVLDNTAVPQLIDDLHLPSPMIDQIRMVCAAESGMLLVCGPTGSGKSTTLYAALRGINIRQRNVITIEDPIEYQMEGVTQLPANDLTGNTFASLLRSTLRQDPDVILLGEVRDAEAARTAIQAAMTGHVVLSTVHAQDAFGAITRLIDLKVEANLITSSLNIVLAQRLVRLLCRHCKRRRRPTPPEAERLAHHGYEAKTIYDVVGCSKCLHSGYHNRRALFEMLVINEAVKQSIVSSPDAIKLQEMVDENSYMPLARSAWQAVAEGVTSVEEVKRVIFEI